MDGALRICRARTIASCRVTLAIMPVLSRAHIDADRFRGPEPADSGRPGPIGLRRSSPASDWCSSAIPTTGRRTCRSRKRLYNFDIIRIDYYRDATAMFEAFKAGLIDFRVEEDPIALAHRIRFSRGQGRAHRQGHDSERPAEGRLGLRLQRPPAALRRSPRARGALLDVRLRMDQR